MQQLTHRPKPSRPQPAYRCTRHRWCAWDYALAIIIAILTIHIGPQLIALIGASNHVK